MTVNEIVKVLDRVSQDSDLKDFEQDAVKKAIVAIHNSKVLKIEYAELLPDILDEFKIREDEEAVKALERAICLVGL